MSFKNAPISDVLRAFSRDYRLNIVIEDGIEGEVTANFENVSVGDALSAILEIVGCGWERKGNVIMVAQKKPIRRLFKVDYPITEELRTQIQELLSGDGKVVVDPASSTILIIDLPQYVSTVGEFLKLSAGNTKQVIIEAKIVEVGLDKNDEMGIDWNKIDFSPLGIADVTAEVTQSLAPLPPDPNEEGAGWSGFQFAISHERASFLLQALAKHTNVDLLSSPRVATLNNQKATIKVIEKIPYVRVSTDIAEAGYISTRQEVEFEEVGIVLEATPQIAPDGDIFLTIRPEVSEVTRWFNGQPVVDKRTVETRIKVGDGETVIIGGLLRNSTTQTISKVPLLGDIPGLGILMRHKEEVRRKTELLIFISPKVIPSKSQADVIQETESRLDEMRNQIKPGLFH